jgi:hypothetical protein
MLQKSRFSRIQLYHFDPTNAASEKKDRETTLKQRFCLDSAFQGSMRLYATQTQSDVLTANGFSMLLAEIQARI